MFKRRCTVAVACVSLSGTAVADIINVPGEFPTIQAAIDAAMDGDEVEVHPGTYNEAINFLGKAITLYSSGGAAVTTIRTPRSTPPNVLDQLLRKVQA